MFSRSRTTTSRNEGALSFKLRMGIGPLREDNNALGGTLRGRAAFAGTEVSSRCKLGNIEELECLEDEEVPGLLSLVCESVVSEAWFQTRKGVIFPLAIVVG